MNKGVHLQGRNEHVVYFRLRPVLTLAQTEGDEVVSWMRLFSGQVYVQPGAIIRKFVYICNKSDNIRTSEIWYDKC